MPKDYSTVLFSLKGAEPSWLPPRLRLPSGDTRYSNCISLSDIESLGYIGPVEFPTYDSDKFICFWDPDSLTFVIQEKTQQQLDKELDTKVRATLSGLLLKASKVNISKWSIEAVQEYNKYVDAINIALEKTRNLTEIDIPELNLTNYLYEEDAQALYESIVTPETLAAWKIEYGFALPLQQPFPWELQPITRNRFKIPPDWNTL